MANKLFGYATMVIGALLLLGPGLHLAGVVNITPFQIFMDIMLGCANTFIGAKLLFFTDSD